MKACVMVVTAIVFVGVSGIVQGKEGNSSAERPREPSEFSLRLPAAGWQNEAAQSSGGQGKQDAAEEAAPAASDSEALAKKLTNPIADLSMLFSLGTHREVFASAESGESGEVPWPLGLALATLAGVTVLVALVSEVFVESVQKAAEAFGMTPAFVGFIVVALVGGAAEMAAAFSGARKNRLDLSVGIALGSASQIALFVAPVLMLASYFIGPTPMDLRFWPGAVVMILIAIVVAAFVTNSGRSAWFVGVLLLMVYMVFAMTLYLLPPGAQ